MAPRNRLLDAPMLGLSDKDFLRFRDLIEGGTLVTGGLGTGKSSTSLKQLACAFMRMGLGGLFCTVKSEDAANYVAYAKECGREKDVILFNEKSGLTFDPLAYESARGVSNIETLVDYCSILFSVGKHQDSTNNEKFWEKAAEQATRHAIKVIQLSGEPLSIANINRAIQSFPTRPGQQEEEAWERESYCASLINAIRARKETLTPDDWSDLDVATQFIFSKWPAYDEKPRGSIEMTVAGVADRFLFQPMRKIFAGGSFSFTPEQMTHEHAIVIGDFPVLHYGKETARVIQIILKLTCQRAWLRHKFSEGCCNGGFLVLDEFQFLLSKFDNHFSQVCRSSGIAVVCATQTIMGVAEELGEIQPGSKTKGFLNNLSVKIAHNCTCSDTAQYLADTIGKEYRYLEGYNAGGDQHHAHAGVSGSRQLAHIIEPVEFSRLLKPDSTNPYAEAIVWHSGRVFEATKTDRDPKGRNYLRVLFSRDT